MLLPRRQILHPVASPLVPTLCVVGAFSGAFCWPCPESQYPGAGTQLATACFGSGPASRQPRRQLARVISAAWDNSPPCQRETRGVSEAVALWETLDTWNHSSVPSVC